MIIKIRLSSSINALYSDLSKINFKTILFIFSYFCMKLDEEQKKNLECDILEEGRDDVRKLFEDAKKKKRRRHGNYVN